MNGDRGRPAMLVLRWVLGLVILEASVRFAFSRSAAHELTTAGIPSFVHVGLAWCEMVAAVLFLIPGLVVIGGYCLIGVLVFAILVHLLHGWYDVGGLVVYGVAAWAAMSTTREKAIQPAGKS